MRNKLSRHKNSAYSNESIIIILPPEKTNNIKRTKPTIKIVKKKIKNKKTFDFPVKRYLTFYFASPKRRTSEREGWRMTIPNFPLYNNNNNYYVAISLLWCIVVFFFLPSIFLVSAGVQCIQDINLILLYTFIINGAKNVR